MSHSDPILKQLLQPGAKEIAPRIDNYHVPWCSDQCPYYERKDSTVTHDLVARCALLDRMPERVCVPGVHMLVDMAGQLMETQHKPEAIIGSPKSKEELHELRKAFKPMDFRPGMSMTMHVDKPFSVKEFIEQARAAGHDALGLANDPEAIATLEAVKARHEASPYPEGYHPDPYELPSKIPTEATVVEGEVSPDALYGAQSAYNRDDDVVYRIKLVRKEPGNVEFLLTINGRVCGQMPFDNLIKASVRIDPHHASGPEKQIQKLRKETAEAKAEMYDWQAKAMQLEERLKQYEAAEAVPNDGD